MFLYVDVRHAESGDVCDVAMMSTPNVIMTELPDLLYNQCIDNTCCYLFFIYPTGQIRVCKKRFVSTGENGGISCRVYKTEVHCLVHVSQSTESLLDMTISLSCTPSNFNV